MDWAHEVHRADRDHAQSTDVFGIASAGARTRIGLAAQYRHSTGALAGMQLPGTASAASCAARWRGGLRGAQRHGSSIKVVRGGLDGLHRRTCEPSARRSIEQARVYHGAALANFEGMILSRCNYDVAQGRDRSG